MFADSTGAMLFEQGFGGQSKSWFLATQGRFLRRGLLVNWRVAQVIDGIEVGSSVCSNPLNGRQELLGESLVGEDLV